MKGIRRVLLALCLVLAMSVPVQGLAAESSTGKAAQQESRTVTADELHNGTWQVAVQSDVDAVKVATCNLTAHNGKLTGWVNFSGSYAYLFVGTAQQAQESARSAWISPDRDDYGKNWFTMVVPALGEPTQVALYNRSYRKWVDARLTFTTSGLPATAYVKNVVPDDGVYAARVSCSGGEKLESLADIHVSDGEISLSAVFTDSPYEALLVGGTRYDLEGKTIDVPVSSLDHDIHVTAITTKGKKVALTIRVSSKGLKKKGLTITLPQLIAIVVVLVAVVLIVRSRKKKKQQAAVYEEAVRVQPQKKEQKAPEEKDAPARNRAERRAAGRAQGHSGSRRQSGRRR